MGARERDDDLWIGGIVPYEINPDLGNTQAIEEAMAILEAKTNLRFVERFLQDDHVWFAKQTQGNPHAGTGRNGGRQYVSASGNSIGTLLHEIGHAVGLSHEHQRSDRDNFIIFHADRVTDGDYEKKDTPWRSPNYDFNSIMHYSGKGPRGTIFESRTGSPPPEEIGSKNVLTPTDVEFLKRLYPNPPVVRRSGGHDGAGMVGKTSAVATRIGTDQAVVVNAVTNGDGDYQVVMWEVSANGVIVRGFDPPSATGGPASIPRIGAIGSQFLAAMRDADEKLLLISHDWQLMRTGDSHGQAGKVRDLDLLHLGTNRVLTPCVTEGGKLLNIVWGMSPDGSINRISSTTGASARSVKSTLLADGTVALLCDDGDKLVLSTWAIERSWDARRGSFVEKVTHVADSGNQMGHGSSSTVVQTPSGTVVVVCQAENDELLLIPFEVGSGGTTVRRAVGKDARAGKIREVTAVPRPYGLLTAVASQSGNLLLIKWGVTRDGTIHRLGESGTQAGAAAAISMVALPFGEDATICTTLRDGGGRLLPITWDDLDGPGELNRYRLPPDGRPDPDDPLRDLGGVVIGGP